MLSTLGILAVLTPMMLDSTTPQGKLVIDETKVGEGPACDTLDMVEVHYTGTLLDGTKFDSSLDRGEPFRFQLGVGHVIKGWDLGVTGMKVEGIRNLTIPSDLAYGDRGAGDVIPPKATLNFKVKLVRILPRTVVETVKEGTGEGMQMGQMLECKVTLKANDGSNLIDTSKPLKLMISRSSLPGLNQGILGIKVGETRKLTMTSELAFGKKGFPTTDTDQARAGSLISPGAKVIAEVEAITISTPKSSSGS
jgi:peptidylprolyl isomerase